MDNTVIFAVYCAILCTLPILVYGLIHLHQKTLLAWIVIMVMLLQCPLLMTIGYIVKNSTKADHKTGYGSHLLPLAVIFVWAVLLAQVYKLWKQISTHNVHIVVPAPRPTPNNQPIVQ